MSETLELEEIQGLITSGYGERPTARYALFEIVDAPRARVWLKSLLPALQFSEYRRSARNEPPFLNALCINLAFTHAGLRALGLSESALSGFSLAFQEGPAEPHRARRMGDDGASAPESWAWGKPGEPLHGMLAVFAGTDDADPEEWEQIDACILSHLRAENGVRALSVLDTMPANRLLRKEHFGFRDGIANPRLCGLSAPDAGDLVADGEILLGYANGYGKRPLSPEVPNTTDPSGILPKSAESSERRDFGRNGSYLVFRQLEQNARAFWQYVHEASAGLPDSSAEGDDWLAAKLVGRWRNGTPLTRYPEQPGPEDRSEDNQFLYGEHEDAFGARCPIGSHIRRTNPRDTALPVPHDPELSGTPEDPEIRESRLKLADLHRILRRGRPYGEPLSPTYDPEEMRTAAPESSERGIHFLCFNANLSRQFEFVQSNWALNPTFAGLSRDPDPLLCAGRTFPFPASDFTIPGLPPRRVRHLPRVVEVRGAAYFFMPSKSALSYLSAL